ncbi:MAG TPA: DUF4198 domain-containing protein [Verrucomicrobiae bacterium]|nr:DUF4198 domain-containing protein [Verrucomicrobiae bacterium]
MKIRFIISLATFALIAFGVHAHSVWIEDTKGGKLIVRFGELGEELEKSPGYLDELSQPVAWTEGKTNAVPLKVKKKSDNFALSDVKASQAAFVQTDFSVLSAPGKPGRWPIFYARWYVAGSGAAKPELTFDLVPTGAPGEIKVYFHNKPLPDAKVTVTTPDGKDTDLTSDADGLVHFTADKPGLYLAASVHQRDTLPGYSRGVPYDLISHDTALTWRQP